MILEANNIFKSYGGLHVLKGINMAIKKGEVISIVGASGAGKSTLLHILGTLDSADQGKVVLNSTEIHSLSSRKLSAFRNKHIGFVFQFHHLLPEFTALENVMIPALIGGLDKENAKVKALSLLRLLNVEDRENHRPSELSGGEQQRVAVARALVNDPSVVFADEPSGNLDSGNAANLHNLFFELRSKLNQTFVVVTHNEDLANMADRKLTIKDGMIS